VATATIEAPRPPGAAEITEAGAAADPDAAAPVEAGRLTAAVDEAARGELRESLRANNIRFINYKTMC
jgi:hypothetical protein